MSNLLGIIRGFIMKKTYIIFVSFLLLAQVCSAPYSAALSRQGGSSPDRDYNRQSEGMTASPVSPVTKRVSFSTEHVSGLVTNVECTIANKRAFSNDCTVVNPKDEQSAIEGLLEKSLPESQKHTCAVLLHKLGFPVTRSALDKLVRIEDSLEERRRTAIRNVLDDDSLSLAQKHARSVRLHKRGCPLTSGDLKELVKIEDFLYKSDQRSKERGNDESL